MTSCMRSWYGRNRSIVGCTRLRRADAAPTCAIRGVAAEKMWMRPGPPRLAPRTAASAAVSRHSASAASSGRPATPIDIDIRRPPGMSAAATASRSRCAPDERAGLRGLGEQDHELLAGVARDDVGRARVRARRIVLQERRAMPAQDLVADLVAEVVVDGREAVDVGDEQRHRLAVAQRARDLFAQALLERAVRVEAGQRIAQRERVELVAHLRELLGRRRDLAAARLELRLELALVLAQARVGDAELVEQAAGCRARAGTCGRADRRPAAGPAASTAS